MAQYSGDNTNDRSLPTWPGKGLQRIFHTPCIWHQTPKKNGPLSQKNLVQMTELVSKNVLFR